MLTDPEGRQTLIPVRDLYRIADSALRETQNTFHALDIPSGGLDLEHQAEHARYILESVPGFDGAGLQTLEKAVETAARAVRQGDFGLTETITALLDAVRAAGFDRAVFSLVNEDHTWIRGRLASGRNAAEVLRRFHFPMDRDAGPFQSLQRTEILVDRSRDDRYNHTTLVKTYDPAAFALLLIVVDQETAGCLYADRQISTSGLDAFRSVLSRARDVIAAAMRKKAPHIGG
jgi:hypothetical protein